MSFAFSETSLRRMDGVDPRLKHIAQLALTISRVDFGIPEYGGLRTEEEQRELFDSGASKRDGKDKKSYHQSGKALDFYAYVDGRASWDELHLAMVAAAFLQAASILGHSLQWGGLWEDFQDMPHVQLLEK